MIYSPFFTKAIWLHAALPLSPERSVFLLLVSHCVLIKQTLPLMSLISSHLLQLRHSCLFYASWHVFFPCPCFPYFTWMTPSVFFSFLPPCIVSNGSKLSESPKGVLTCHPDPLCLSIFTPSAPLQFRKRYRFVAPYLWHCSTLAYCSWQSVCPAQATLGCTRVMLLA